MRSTVRLKAGNNNGSVVLRRLSVPVILCDLRDISEMGCRCVAHVRINDWSDANKWREALKPGELYEAEITFDPHIPFIRLPIEIRSSAAIPGDGYELGISFFELEPDHRQMLNTAMISIATEKIRQSKGVLKREESVRVSGEGLSQDSPPNVYPRISAFASHREKPGDVLRGAGIEKKSLTPVNDGDTRPARVEPKLGEVLKRSAVLTKGEVANAVFSSREKGQKLGEYLINEGVLTPLQVLQARSAQTGLSYVDFDMNNIPMEMLDLFPFSKMKALNFVPFEIEDGLVRVACANPLPKNEADALERIAGKRLECYLCREELPRQYLEGVARRFDRYRRLHPRYKLSLPATFKCCTPSGELLADTTFRGRTIDISEGGMQVAGPVILGLDPNELTPGHLKLMVTLGAMPEDIVGVCETRHVRYTRNYGGGTTCIYGLKLADMSEPHRDILQGLIARVTRSDSGINDDRIETAVPIEEGEA